MSTHRFTQLDVFSAVAGLGNALAVVHDAEGLTDEELARFARWTNLSETTFLLPPTDRRADYRVRIFTPGRELPFAGHPTLGSAAAWLAAGGEPRNPGQVWQECGSGLVPVRLIAESPLRLAFAAPPLTRQGPVSAPELERVLCALALQPESVVAAEWIDNGPGWIGLLLDSAATVLAVRPDAAHMGGVKVGIAAVDPDLDTDADLVVRAFFSAGDAWFEDPVTGSLNAGLAQWLMAASLAPSSYVAAQGHQLQRAGRIYLDTDDAGQIWVGGDVTLVINGTASHLGASDRLG